MAVKFYDCPKCKCRHLGRSILGKELDSICFECFGSEENGEELNSSNAIRCPACGEYESDLCETVSYEEGEHWASCGSCGEDYRVETTVTYNFRSPALGAKELQ